MIHASERCASPGAVRGSLLGLLPLLVALGGSSPVVAQVYAEQLRTRGFGLDLQLEGGVGLGLQRPLDNAFLARVRLGGLYAYEPWIVNAGPTLELGGLAGLGVGAEIEVNSFGGLFSQVAMARVDNDAWMTRLAFGFTIVGAEWQHRLAAGADDDALLFVVRVPLGIWWFLVRDDDEAKDKAKQARAHAGAPSTALASMSTVEQASARAPSVTDDDRLRAQQDIERARQEREKGNHALEAAALSHAYQLEPDPMLLLLIADAEQAHGALVAATQSLRRFLTAAATPEALHERSTAQARLDALLPLLSQLRLSLSPLPAPSDVQVELDGQRAPGALLGYDVPLDPGTHELVVTRGREVVLRRTLHAEQGRVVRVEVPLAASEAQQK